MKRKTLTKRQIRKATVAELIFKMNCLHVESERRPEDDGVPMTDIQEGTTIVKELRRRLGSLGVFLAGENQ